MPKIFFLRLRLKTLQLAAEMKGKVNRAEARKSEGGLGYGATWRAIARKSDGGFRFDTPQLATGSFIDFYWRRLAIIDALLIVKILET